MHTTSTQSLSDHRTAARGALAAIIFAAGIALGAVVGPTVAPLAAPQSVSSQVLDPDAAGFRLHRAGEIGVGTGAADNGLRDQRRGEIGADTQ
jgi:MFS family permease